MAQDRSSGEAYGGRQAGAPPSGRGPWLARASAAVAAAVLASTIGVLAVASPTQARPSAPHRAASTEPPAAGAGIGATATGKVTKRAPLPADLEASADVQPLVPGTLRVAPDRSPFRTPEALSTPLDLSKAAAYQAGTNSMEVGPVQVGDLNGDGIDDLVNGIQLSYPGIVRTYVSAMLGLGDGQYTDPTFSLAATPQYSNPYDLVLADVDADDHLDVIMSTTDQTTGSLVLLKGDGLGSFGPPITSNAVANPGIIRVGRWGGTADVQIAVLANKAIHVLDVNPEGFDDLTPTGVGILNPDRNPETMVAGDADDDGQDELYLSMDYSYTSDFEGVQRLTDLTAATPSRSWVEGVRNSPQRIGLADVDGDHRLDLVTSAWRSVAYGNQYWLHTYPLPGRDPDAPPFGEIRLSPMEDTCDQRPQVGQILAADADHDGDTDLFLGDCAQQMNTVALAVNDGTGTFDVRYYIDTPGERGTGDVAGLNRRPMGSAIIDANGDDRPDFVWAGGSDGVANGDTIVLGDPAHDGELQAPPLLDPGYPLYRSSSLNAQQAIIADWNEDGDKDVVMLADTAIVWKEGDGTGRFGDPQLIETRASSSWCAPANAGELGVADLDGDGHLDLVCHSQGTVGMAWGAGPGQPLTPDPLNDVPNYSNWNGYHGIDLVDLDGDGDLEVVVPVFSGDFDEGSYGYVWFQGADRAWPTDPAVAKMGSATTFAVGNVDDDPEPELVSLIDRRKDAGGTVQWFDRFVAWSADGAGGLTEHVSDVTASRVADGTSSVPDVAQGLGDLDGDGILDLVTVWYYGNPLYQHKLLVWKGLGDGEYAPTATAYPTTLSWGGNGYQRGGDKIHVRDIDGDGNRDVVYDSTTFGVEIYPGNGDGTLSTSKVTRWPAGNFTGSLQIGDLDHDDRPDLIAGTDFSWDTGPVLSHVLLMNRSIPGSDAAPDLAVTDLSAPTSVGDGDDVTVEATITNQGGDVKSGATWTDAAWLSATPGVTLASSSIQTKTRQGPLAAGSSYTVELTGPAEAFAEGVEHLVVRADATQRLTEADETNNQAVRDVTVSAPVLTPGGPELTLHVADGHRRLVRIPAVGGRTVAVTATPASAGGVRGRIGVDAAPKPGGGTQLRATGTGPLVGSSGRATDGDLYLVVDGLSAAGTDPDGAAAAVTLVATDAAVAITSASPGRVSNGGDVTLTVTGAGLEGSAMQLVPRSGSNGGAVDATRVRPGATAGTWFATFPLTDQLGSFDLKASGPDGDAVLPSAVLVEAPVVTPNQREFEVSVSLPGQIRRHVPAPGGDIRPGYLGRLVVRNRTGSDLPAPILRFEAEGLDVAWPDIPAGQRAVAPDAPAGSDTVVRMLGTTVGGPVDTIPARASVTIEFRIFATMAPDYAVQVGVWSGSDQSGEIDWSTEAQGLAAGLALPAAAAGPIQDALEELTSHPTRPTYPGASPTGPWPTPGGYARALGRMAAALDGAGRSSADFEEVRGHLTDSALAIADVGAPASGRLTDPGGAEPGEPLDVSAAPVDGSGPILSGTAAPDGRFNLFADPGSGAASAEDYQVQVSGRLVTEGASFALTPGSPVTGLAVAVDPGLRVTGTIVRAADGSPVAGAQVALFPTAADAPDSPVSVTTDALGRFTASGLAAGDHHLGVIAGGLASLDDTVSVAGPGTTVLDRSLDPEQTITGSVTAAGGGAAKGAVVTAYRSDVPVGTAQTGDDGGYALDGLSGAPVTLVATDADGGWASADATPGDEDVDLALAAPIDVTGTLVDAASGDPVAGGTVATAGGPIGSTPATATTGSDGTFTLADLAPTAVDLLGSAPDGGSSVPVPVDPAHPTGIVLRIEGQRHITGMVTDAAGDPLAGLMVEAVADQPREIDGAVAWPGASGTTDADGHYDVPVPGVGSYALSTLDGAAAVEVQRDQPDPTADLVVHGALVQGRVVDAGGDPVANRVVNLVVADSFVSSTTTDPDGRYRLPVRGGTEAVLWVGAPEVGIGRAEVSVPSSGTVDVPDIGPGSASLSVAVTGPGGPVGGELHLEPLAPSGDSLPSQASAVVAADGTATIGGLEPGRYRLAMVSDGLAVAIVDVDTATAGPVAIALGPARSYSTTIVETDGSPLVGAQATLASTTSPFQADGVTGTDGSVTFTGLADGTYDLWVSPIARPTALLAQGVVVAPPAAPLRGPAGAAAGLRAEPVQPLESQVYDSNPPSPALHGTITGPNGIGLGPNPPTVVARVDGTQVSVEVKPDGTWSLASAPAGPVVIEVRKEGHETARYPFVVPDDGSTAQAIAMGLPIDAADKLRPEPPPAPLPSLWTAFTSLFDFVDPDPRVSDPLMQTIIDAEVDANPCPDSATLLLQAQRYARMAQSQNQVANELLERRYKQKWDRGWLFTVHVIDVANSVVAAMVPLAQAAKKSIGVFKYIDSIDELKGLSQVAATVVQLPVTAMVTDLTTSITEAILGGNPDIDALAFAAKGTADLLRFALEAARDAMQDPKVQLALSDTILRAFGLVLTTFGAAYDVYSKTVASIDDLVADYQAIKDMEVGATQANDLANQLEQRAKRLYFLWLGQSKGRVDCDKPKDLPTFRGGVGSAVDPNEVVGPTGEGSDRWLVTPAGLGYEIHFENLGPGTEHPPPGAELATAPAAQVVVTETVPATFDRSSFTFDDVGWGQVVVDVPDGVQAFEQDVPISVDVDGEVKALVVRASGDYDPGTGEATWTFTTLDPETGKIPLDPREGFLPPEPGDESGQGWAGYSISGASGLAQGTYLDAQADIVFDTNDPLATNTWRNRVGMPGGDACPETDTRDGRFVCALYRAALGREPDVAGRTYWVGRLGRPASSGGTTRAAMASSFVGSVEGRRVVVDRLYQQLLDRKADPSGRAFWAERLGRRGARRDDLRRSITGSDEYLRRAGGTRAGFVAELYQDVLGRPVDPAGSAHWVAALTAGRSRASVAAAFLASSEARRRLVRSAYQRIVDRPATADEVTWWSVDLSRTRNDEVRLDTRLMTLPEFAD